MGVLGWILFGLVVGLIARFVMPGKDSMGLILTSGLGILGAVVAGWLGRALGWYDTNSGAGMIASVIGAVLVLAIYRAATGRRRRGRDSNDRIDRFAA